MNVPVLIFALLVFAWSADKLRQLHPLECPLRSVAWLIVATFAARLMGMAWLGLTNFEWSMGLHFDLAVWSLAGLAWFRHRKQPPHISPTVPPPFDSDKR